MIYLSWNVDTSASDMTFHEMSYNNNRLEVFSKWLSIYIW